MRQRFCYPPVYSHRDLYPTRVYFSSKELEMKKMIKLLMYVVKTFHQHSSGLTQSQCGFCALVTAAGKLVQNEE